MDKVPSKVKLDPKKFGDIVNDKVTKPDEYELKINQINENIECEAKLTLTTQQYQQLLRSVRDINMTKEQYIQKLVVESLEGSINKPLINGPSWLKRVKGPTNFNR